MLTQTGIQTTILDPLDPGGLVSYREIATALSISVSMVEKRMSQAIRILKKEVLTDIPFILLMVSGNEQLKL